MGANEIITLSYISYSNDVPRVNQTIYGPHTVIIDFVSGMEMIDEENGLIEYYHLLTYNDDPMRILYLINNETYEIVPKGEFSWEDGVVTDVSCTEL